MSTTDTKVRTWRAGDIVINRTDGRRGVIIAGPFRPGDRPPLGVSAHAGVGDVVIRHAVGVHTTTNIPEDWEPIPAGETTAEERLRARSITFRADFADLVDDDRPENDLPVFAWVEALLPPADREAMADNYPSSVWEMLVEVAAHLDRRTG